MANQGLFARERSAIIALHNPNMPGVRSRQNENANGFIVIYSCHIGDGPRGVAQLLESLINILQVFTGASVR